MSLNDLNLALKLMKDKFSDTEIMQSGPKSEATIQAAEGILGVQLPNTYKHFIKSIGWGGPGLIPGLLSDNVDKLRDEGFVWGVLDDRKSGYPNHIISLYDLGEGSTYCLDLSQMNNQGECPVVAWPLEGYQATPKLEVVAEDFGKFFLDMVEQAIKHKNDS